MSDPKTEINKVQISDVQDDNRNTELEDSQLDKVSGGGYTYGYDGGNPNT